MPDSKNYYRPETLAKIRRLDLRARHIVEGFLSGMHRSPYFGQSVEFLQHREYVPGDDLRHVDWKVWGRQDRLYVKQFEEDTNMRVHLLVDASSSMAYGNGPLNKFDYAATIATALTFLVGQAQDAVGCVTFDDRIRHRVPTLTSGRQLQAVSDLLVQHQPRDKTSLGSVLHEAAELFPRRGMVILCSDLFGDVEETLRGLQQLRQRGHDVLVFQVLDQDELEFPFEGATRFEDLETEIDLNCNPKALRDGYLEELHSFLDALRRGCARNSVDYSLVSTQDSLDAVLSSFLTRRTREAGARHVR